MEVNEELEKDMTKRDIDNQKQEQHEMIEKSIYNPTYKRINTYKQSILYNLCYKGKRCENQTAANHFWKRAEEKRSKIRKFGASLKMYKNEIGGNRFGNR